MDSEQVPKISDSEWRVMRVLWAKSPATANEVVNALSEQMLWKPKTVKTLLNRLVVKGALRYEKQGRQYEYYPAVEEAKCVKAEGRSFLDRVHGGRLRPMLAALLEDESLTGEEIAELRRILEQKGGQ